MNLESGSPRRAPDVVDEADVEMRATSEAVLELVMDVERYRQVASKIGKIHWVRRSPDGQQVTFRFTPRLGAVPALMRSTQHVTRHGDRLLITANPRGSITWHASRRRSFATRRDRPYESNDGCSSGSSPRCVHC